MKPNEQIKKDVEFCKNILGLSDLETDSLCTVTTKMGISCEYFADEFVVDVDTVDDVLRLNDPEYLQINWNLS